MSVAAEHWLAVAPRPSDLFVRAVDELERERPAVLLDLSGERAQGFVVAVAATVSAALVNDMLVHARGTPWLVLPEQRCLAFGLAPIGRSERPGGLSFFTSIEARDNVTTGVSAHDRAHTMRVAGSAEARPEAISTPGHVMPIAAPPDGMLNRACAVDAALALVERAGHPGGAAICQILDPDGEPSDAAATRRYASEHGLPLVSTVDVLDAYLSDRQLVRRSGNRTVSTAAGEVPVQTYGDVLGRRHFVLTWGEVRTAGRPVLAAVHTQDPLADLFDDRPEGPRARLAETVERLAGDGVAVLLCLSAPATSAADDSRSRLLSAKLQSHVATAILRDLGVGAVRTT